MATLEITKKRIKVVGLPEEDDRHWSAKLVEKLFSKNVKKKRFAPAETYALHHLSKVATTSVNGERPIFWNVLGSSIELYKKKQKFYILVLTDQNGRTPIIASWNFMEINHAYSQVDTAINGDDNFSVSVHIENSNIVIGATVNGNIDNKVGGGGGAAAAS